MTCDRCDTEHNPSCCQGHSSRTGKQCGKRPVKGGTKCATHGLAKGTPGRAAADARVAERELEEQARAAVMRFNARRDIHPAEALIDLVQYQAGIVEYWRGEVELVDRDALTWGITREKDDGTDKGTTHEAKPNVVYSMLREASRDLAEYCKAALAAGVSERLVQVAEQQGHQLVAVFVATMSRLGVDVSPGSEAAGVFLEELRRLRGSGGGGFEELGGGAA